MWHLCRNNRSEPTPSTSVINWCLETRHRFGYIHVLVTVCVWINTRKLDSNPTFKTRKGVNKCQRLQSDRLPLNDVNLRFLKMNASKLISKALQTSDVYKATDSKAEPIQSSIFPLTCELIPDPLKMPRTAIRIQCCFEIASFCIANELRRRTTQCAWMFVILFWVIMKFSGHG